MRSVSRAAPGRCRRWREPALDTPRRSAFRNFVWVDGMGAGGIHCGRRRRRLRRTQGAIGKEYNLKLLFAAKDGRYLADVAVSIKDDADRAVLVTTSEGPFLFVQLPPGKYRITTDYAGVVQARTTSVAASGRREMVFRWDEAAD